MFESNGHMTHSYHHPWSKSPSLGSLFPKPIDSPLKELQSLTFIGYFPNHTYSNTLFFPFSSIQEPTDGYQSLIPEFKPINDTFPYSVQLLP